MQVGTNPRRGAERQSPKTPSFRKAWKPTGPRLQVEGYFFIELIFLGNGAIIYLLFLNQSKTAGADAARRIKGPGPLRQMGMDFRRDGNLQRRAKLDRADTTERFSAACPPAVLIPARFRISGFFITMAKYAAS